MLTDVTAPICLASYAVTLEGARRMLYEIGLMSLGGTVDGEFISRVVAGKAPSIMVVPPLMSQWKSGDMERDSDLRYEQHLGDSSGPHIVRSIHRELRDLIYEKGLAVDWSDEERNERRGNDEANSEEQGNVLESDPAENPGNETRTKSSQMRA